MKNTKSQQKNVESVENIQIQQFSSCADHKTTQPQIGTVEFCGKNVEKYAKKCGFFARNS